MITDVDRLIQLLAKLPGLGPRSARRAVLDMIKRPEANMRPLARALMEVADAIRPCEICHNIDTHSPCTICQDPRRQNDALCVVAEVADLWALERARAFRGRYHVLGGTLSAMEGRGPDQLNIDSLLRRLHLAKEEGQPLREVILALGATVEGQTTLHYLQDRLAGLDLEMSVLAQGLPVGGELDYLDDGTLTLALQARKRYGQN
jgi:recombination protein RecR